jgi:hypothetical protein
MPDCVSLVRYLICSGIVSFFSPAFRHFYMYRYLHINIHMHIRITFRIPYVCVRIHKRIHIHTSTYLYRVRICVPVHIRIHIGIRIRTYMYTYKHTYTSTVYIYLYIEYTCYTDCLIFATGHNFPVYNKSIFNTHHRVPTYDLEPNPGPKIIARNIALQPVLLTKPAGPGDVSWWFKPLVSISDKFCT